MTSRTLLLLLLSGGCAAARPPATPRVEVRERLHGVEIVDPYRWLEDQKSPATRAWIDAQDRHTHALLDRFPGRAGLRRDVEALLQVDTIGLPVERGGRYFFSRRRAGQDLFVVYVREGLQGKDEVLLDPHPLSPDHTVSLGLVDVSQDGGLVAYSV